MTGDVSSTLCHRWRLLLLLLLVCLHLRVNAHQRARQEEEQIPPWYATPPHSAGKTHRQTAGVTSEYSVYILLFSVPLIIYIYIYIIVLQINNDTLIKHLLWAALSIILNGLLNNIKLNSNCVSSFLS